MNANTLPERTSVPAILSISSKNYSSWSLRAWLMLKMSGLSFIEEKVDIDSPGVRAELLLLAPSILVPCLSHNGIRVWDTLAIGEYLNEVAPNAGLLPPQIVQRAHCRSICGEMHSGFAAMRSSLPMNLKVKMQSFKVWSKAQADIDRIIEIWTDCLSKYSGPYLFGQSPTIADAMFAPVATRFVTYAVSLPSVCENYRDTVMAMPFMREWISQAILEHEDFDELDMDF
ncbi:MAG: glutathione S-transferase family protein [Actinomycetota bacterium]